MVQQRVLNEVNIHCDRGLRHSSIVRVGIIVKRFLFFNVSQCFHQV
jgi:hypothetical protein